MDKLTFWKSAQRNVICLIRPCLAGRPDYSFAGRQEFPKSKLKQRKPVRKRRKEKKKEKEALKPRFLRHPRKFSMSALGVWQRVFFCWFLYFYSFFLLSIFFYHAIRLFLPLISPLISTLTNPRAVCPPYSRLPRRAYSVSLLESSCEPWLCFVKPLLLLLCTKIFENPKSWPLDHRPPQLELPNCFTTAYPVLRLHLCSPARLWFSPNPVLQSCHYVQRVAISCLPLPDSYPHCCQRSQYARWAIS